MAIKDIMMVIDPGPEGVHVDEFTLSLAQTFGAHVTALGYAPMMIAPVSFAGDYPIDLMTEAVEEARQDAKRAFERLATAAPAGVETESRILEGFSGEINAAIGRAARHFDFTIIRQSSPDDPDYANEIMISVLYSSGRPAFVVPYIHKGPAKLEKVMIAWDGGMVAARAIAGAMPLLERSKSVEVVRISNLDADQDEIKAFDMTHHLARHGVKAELKSISAGNDIASTLLSHASDTGADYMIMGCYGHSRLREFVIGGTTRTILDSMTIPVFLAH